MISVTKLRNGVTFEENGKPFRVLKYQHTHLSRGGGTVKVQVRNLSDGSNSHLTFKSGANVKDIDVNRKQLQYLYQDEDSLVFMDPKTFEQVELKAKVAGDQAKFLEEGEEVWVLEWDDKILDLDLPPSLIYEVASCDPGERGNSVSNVYKGAKLKNGLSVKVPLFINQGDKVKVDTRTGEYVERVAG